MTNVVCRNLAILILSSTTALAGPVFAQQADSSNPLVLPEGQGQGSAQSEGGTDMKSGTAGGSAGADAQGQMPDSGTTEQNSAEGSGTAGGEVETQTSEKPADNDTDQDAAQSSSPTTGETGGQATAEGDKATEGETTPESTAGASNSEETEDSAQSAPSTETTASIDIDTEQRTEIRNVIVESDAKPVDIDIDVNVGAVVPRTVELRPLPPRIIEIVPAYRAYKYILLADGRILIIEPATLKIVYVITA